MVPNSDLYEILGVSKTATLDEIKKAYRKKALEFHPDRNPGDKAAEEKFKEATEAYSILSEPEARQKYDQFGHAAFQQGAGGFGGFEGFGDFSGFEDIFGDIFGSFFGGAAAARGGKRSRGRAGRDLRYDMEISFEEAAFGAEKEIRLHRKAMCQECGGSGAAAGSKAEACRECAGSGQLRFQQGFFTISRTCHVCGGNGSVVKSPCNACGGQGARSVESKLMVKVPAGIDQGQRLKLRGEGEAGSGGGPAGDLYVQIAVRKHEIFERQEAELICEVPVSFATAALGAEIDVPTLEGTHKLKIPAGTQSGKVFRLKNRGLVVLGTDRRGDEHVRIAVEVPKKLSAEMRAALENIREIEKTEAESASKSFINKVKGMFG